jgi:hypothetical protein
VPFKLGRLPNDPTRPRVKLAAHLNAVSPPPASVSWTGLPDWGMLGNDQWGDCTCAGDGHIVEVLTFYGQGQELIVTTDEALQAYHAVGGFDPAAGPPGSNPTDQGATVQQALDYLHSPGMAGVTVDAIAEVNVASLDEIKAACAELGPLSAGVNLPANAQTQFEAGQPWDVAADDGGIEGGHCIVLAGYDQEYLYFVTWGRVQKATYAWWAKYGEEIWAVVSRDWVNAKGADPEGIDLASLGAEFAALTGEPDPFPAPAPVPAPEPPPVPDPAADPATFLEHLVTLIHEPGRVIEDVIGWLRSHGIHPPLQAPGEGQE